MKIKTRNKTKKIADDISCSVSEKRERKAPIEFFHTGSTNLNLCFAGNPYGGWPRGRVSNIVGDPSTGKTVCCLEGSFQFLKHIKNIRSKIFQDVKKSKVIANIGEGVLDFPLEEMYGRKFIDLLEIRNSNTIESLGSDIIDKTIIKMKPGDSILYWVDSWDSIPSDAERKRLLDSIKSGEPIKGSFGGEKNTYSKNFFSELSKVMAWNKIDFTLFIISQTRDNIGVMFGPKKRRAGGAALDFFTHLVPWLREVEKLSKKIDGEDITYAIEAEAKVKRSKVWKSFRKSRFRILFDRGIDDISSMGAYLATKKVKEFEGLDTDFKNLLKFSKKIEKMGLQDKLRNEVYRIWRNTESKIEKQIEGRERKCL